MAINNIALNDFPDYYRQIDTTKKPKSSDDFFHKYKKYMEEYVKELTQKGKAIGEVDIEKRIDKIKTEKKQVRKLVVELNVIKFDSPITIYNFFDGADWMIIDADEFKELYNKAGCVWRLSDMNTEILIFELQYGEANRPNQFLKESLKSAKNPIVEDDGEGSDEWRLEEGKGF